MSYTSKKQFESMRTHVIVLHGKTIQLDWTPCADTQRINLPRDQEGYDGFKYTNEKLSTRRIQWCVDPSSIFGAILNNNFPNIDNGAWILAQLDAPRRKL